VAVVLAHGLGTDDGLGRARHRRLLHVAQHAVEREEVVEVAPRRREHGQLRLLLVLHGRPPAKAGLDGRGGERERGGAACGCDGRGRRGGERERGGGRGGGRGVVRRCSSRRMRQRGAPSDSRVLR
jgi:hypothetical protein